MAQSGQPSNHGDDSPSGPFAVRTPSRVACMPAHSPDRVQSLVLSTATDGEVRNAVSMVASSDGREVDARILAGQIALRKLRLRVSGTMLLSGIFCACVAQWQYHFRTEGSSLLRDCLGWFLTVGSVICLALAPFPDSSKLTLFVMFLISVIVGVSIGWDAEVFFYTSDHKKYPDGCILPLHASDLPRDYCIWRRSWYAIYMINDITFFCGSVLVMFGIYRAWRLSLCTTLQQRSMWKFLGGYYCCLTIVDALNFVASVSVFEQFFWQGVWPFLPGDVFGLIACVVPQFRLRVHQHLRTVFQRTESLAAAAGIASLVGNCDADELRREANARFRSICLDRVMYNHMATNVPHLELSRQAMSTRMGLCDAFISHSWHDCAVTKWTVLQQWRHAFVYMKGREPSVWLDRCCIDQGNIDADLRCLPIFLSGCSKLVVFCGVTYLSRLWCIIELFTFVHMGCDIEAIELHLLLRDGREEEDRGKIFRLIETFDAGHCKCAVECDSNRLLNIIHTAYGDLQEFNRVVRRIIAKAFANCSDVPSISSDGESETSSDDSSDYCCRRCATQTAHPDATM